MSTLIINPVDRVIIDIADSACQVQNGLQVTKDGKSGVYSALFNLETAEVQAIPEGVAPMTHCYVDGAFVANPDYEGGQ